VPFSGAGTSPKPCTAVPMGQLSVRAGNGVTVGLVVPSLGGLAHCSDVMVGVVSPTPFQPVLTNEVTSSDGPRHVCLSVWNDEATLGFPKASEQLGASAGGSNATAQQEAEESESAVSAVEIGHIVFAGWSA